MILSEDLILCFNDQSVDETIDKSRHIRREEKEETKEIKTEGIIKASYGGENIEVVPLSVGLAKPTVLADSAFTLANGESIVIHNYHQF